MEDTAASEQVNVHESKQTANKEFIRSATTKPASAVGVWHQPYKESMSGEGYLVAILFKQHNGSILEA